MTEQKLVLIVQPVRLQGLIWQAVLKSQKISVIWESPETNLAENLDQLKAAGLVLPDLLILDMQSSGFNPYAFCRWCREQYPKTKVVLTNSGQTEISLSERQWAVNQGASDLLPRFHHENLVSGVAISVKRILEILDSHPLNNGALISVLLNIKRQLEEKATGITSVSRPKVSVSIPDENGHLMIATPKLLEETKQQILTGKSMTNGISLRNGSVGKNGSSNGLVTPNGRSTVSPKTDLPGTVEDVLIKKETTNKTNSTIAPMSVTVHESSQPGSEIANSHQTQATPEADSDPSDSAHTAQPKRRYRGLYY